MVKLGKKVNIKHPLDVHSIVIQKDPFYPNAYIIPLPLDSEPSYIWQSYFEQELRSSLDFWERKVVIVGKELKLVTIPNDIEEKLNWLEKLVTAANEHVEEYNEEVRKKRGVKEITQEAEKAFRTALSRWQVKRVSV